ncbi:hypothetical protein LXL04_027985 [Taraxacum kok-saghyz]
MWMGGHEPSANLSKQPLHFPSKTLNHLNHLLQESRLARKLFASFEHTNSLALQMPFHCCRHNHGSKRRAMVRAKVRHSVRRGVAVTIKILPSCHVLKNVMASPYLTKLEAWICRHATPYLSPKYQQAVADADYIYDISNHVHITTTVRLWIQFTASISSLKVVWRRDHKLDQATENDKAWRQCAKVVKEVLNEPGNVIPLWYLEKRCERLRLPVKIQTFLSRNPGLFDVYYDRLKPKTEPVKFLKFFDQLQRVLDEEKNIHLDNEQINRHKNLAIIQLEAPTRILHKEINEGMDQRRSQRFSRDSSYLTISERRNPEKKKMRDYGWESPQPASLVGMWEEIRRRKDDLFVGNFILRLSLYISFCQGFRPLTTIDQVQKVKSHEKPVGKFFNEEDERVQDRATMEAFIAMDAQSPYDADGIQLADQIVVTELKQLSEFKQSYMKKHIDDASPGTTTISATPSLKMSTLHKDTEQHNLFTTILNPTSALVYPVVNVVLEDEKLGHGVIESKIRKHRTPTCTDACNNRDS